MARPKKITQPTENPTNTFEPKIILPETPAIIIKKTMKKEWVLTKDGWDLV